MMAFEPMDTARIKALLQPLWEDANQRQLEQVSVYLDLLLRWNSRMNLTAIRDSEQIVVRHFGESLYLAGKLSEAGLSGSGKVVDVGSGAGFPGIPLKIAFPEVTITLIEAQQRKAVFLREVLRALGLGADVKNVRAEEFAREHSGMADVVTMRAVEKFESILPVAASLVSRSGNLTILIGSGQVRTAQELLPNWQFGPLLPIPGAESRGILMANQAG